MCPCVKSGRLLHETGGEGVSASVQAVPAVARRNGASKSQGNRGLEGN